jgi:hypothetical protein
LPQQLAVVLLGDGGGQERVAIEIERMVFNARSPGRNRKTAYSAAYVEDGFTGYKVHQILSAINDDEVL